MKAILLFRKKKTAIHRIGIWGSRACHKTHGAIHALWKYIKQNMYLKKLKQLIIGMDGVCATDHFDT